ncbi:MAG: apolipoprotein N-acyltransferase [Actinobacteria bacterium]|nr:apolipoprotein N-acyltransferase [Actinomycetota bacterium]
MPLALHFKFASTKALAVGTAAFALVFFGSLLYWISLFGKPAFIGLVVVQTLWVVTALQLGRMLRDRAGGSWKILAFAPAFLLGEYARSYLPWGGFAWGGLGYTLHDYLPALRLAPYTGVWGLSLILLLVNCILAEALLRARSKPRFAAALIAAVAVIGALPVLLPAGSAEGTEARLALVQGNVPEANTDPLADDDEVVANHVSLTGEIRGDPSLVIWPEGSFDRDPRAYEPYASVLQQTVRETAAPFAVGATTRGGEAGPHNSTLFLESHGEVAGQYDKQRLVPFGEFVPLRSALQPIFSELDRVPIDLMAGDTPTVFSIDEGTFASIICYESTYPDLVRGFVNNGARLLVVSANFSSYERTAAAEQHLAFSQMRAAEHRMWLAHAAVSGRSAVIDPTGDVLTKTRLFEPALLEPEVRFADGVTPYARFGDWVVVLAGVGVVLAIGVSLTRKRSEPEDAPAPEASLQES